MKQLKKKSTLKSLMNSNSKMSEKTKKNLFQVSNAVFNDKKKF